MLHSIMIQNIQTLKVNKIQTIPNNYTPSTSATPATTSATTATISSSPTMVNFPIMHLFQRVLQMMSFLSPFRIVTS